MTWRQLAVRPHPRGQKPGHTCRPHSQCWSVTGKIGYKNLHFFGASSVLRFKQLAVRRSGYNYLMLPPLLNDNEFKLCLFAFNLTGGQTISTAEGVNDPTWEGNIRLAQMADRAGFEALVPVGRWIGFGGPSQYHSKSFESYTWAAGLGAKTDYSDGGRHRTRAGPASDRSGQAGGHRGSHYQRSICP